MALNENIDLGQSPELLDRITANTLTIADHLILSLANFTTTLFPNYFTYVGAQQQAVTGPALFVDYYDIKNSQRLINTDEFSFGIEITYVPTDHKATYEMQNAIFTIQQNLSKLESDIGVFSCYAKDSDITDGLAHVTGIVSVWEVAAPTDPLIQTAEQNVEGG